MTDDERAACLAAWRELTARLFADGVTNLSTICCSWL